MAEVSVPVDAARLDSFARLKGRMGLRARATLAFALGAMLVSSLLALVTYQLVRSRFIEQRINQAVTRAQVNASQIEIPVATSGLAAAAIEQLRIPNRAYTVALNDMSTVCDNASEAAAKCSTITTISEPVDEAERRLRLSVVEDSTSYIVENIKGVPMVIVAVPMYGSDDELIGGYFERVPLRDEAQYLSDLAQSLGVAAVIASLLGAGFGRLVSVRIMKPLKQFARAASELSSGKMDARIEVAPDSDLDPLIGSFNGMADSLQRRIEREARFASDVSHELRTPLTSLTAAVQLLASRREEIPERSRPALDVLSTQTEHFRQLVLDLLEISRFDAGAAELNTTDVDVAELVQQIAAPYGEIVINTDGLQRKKVRLDKRRFERILANLLQNAQNYGGGAKAITLSSIRSESGERQLRLAVDDQGPGIPIEERSAVFERFRRGSVQRTANTKGTGLGLSLVSEHVRLHGGRVWVEDSPLGLPQDANGSDQPRGARFVVIITEGNAPSLAPGSLDGQQLDVVGARAGGERGESEGQS
jgi:two-component system, OmpR family, sensor histidine kinase MtrB